jgi:hypothetical protein
MVSHSGHREHSILPKKAVLIGVKTAFLGKILRGIRFRIYAVGFRQTSEIRHHKP